MPFAHCRVVGKEEVVVRTGQMEENLSLHVNHLSPTLSVPLSLSQYEKTFNKMA